MDKKYILSLDQGTRNSPAIMYDVVIIGAGVIGACIARELSKYNLSILIIDKENDVSLGSSKANSAIVHAGYDANSESLKGKFNVLG
ncbi:MAG: FAD-dependent oxidoreductase, partial [Acidaminobacteraceae bacterium]